MKSLWWYHPLLIPLGIILFICLLACCYFQGKHVGHEEFKREYQKVKVIEVDDPINQQLMLEDGLDLLLAFNSTDTAA